MNRRKILAVALCLTAVCAVILGGCNKSGSTPDEAQTSPAEARTSAVATNTAPAATEAENTFTQAVIATEAQPMQNPEEQICTVNVDGKAYTATVGDTVNYVFNLKTPEALEDFQATTNYDSGMLELIKTDLTKMFPVAGEVVICNTEMPNTVKFNAVNLSGMDFTKGGTFISLEFKVLDSGSVAIGTTLEYMDSVKSEPYVSDYKIVGDIEYSEEIKPKG